MAAIDYNKLKAFLRGEVSLEDLETRRFNRYDITVIAYALAIAHLDELTYRENGQLCLKEALNRALNKHSPLFIYNSHTDASRELGLHVFERGMPTRLTLPAELVQLVEQHKDLPEGGIAKFTALKKAQTPSKPDDDGITPEAVAADVVARLRKVYCSEVLDIIRETL